LTGESLGVTSSVCLVSHGGKRFYPLLVGAHALITQTLFEWDVQRNHAKPGARSVVRGSRGVHILGTETTVDDSPVRLVGRARH